MTIAKGAPMLASSPCRPFPSFSKFQAEKGKGLGPGDKATPSCATIHVTVFIQILRMIQFNVRNSIPGIFMILLSVKFASVMIFSESNLT